MTRSGFVALAGRPNVGKSTLVNALVGRKVAIVSDKPQTTRRAIRGVAAGEDWQLVLVDLPGVQRPRDALTERMQRRVERELGDVFISPDHTTDLREAVVHGVLHLTGMDHETDDGEMLAVQREILTWVTPDP